MINNNFLDESSWLLRYYVGIPNFDLDYNNQLNNILGHHKHSSIDFLGLCTFNESLKLLCNTLQKDNSKNLSSINDLITTYINKMNKKYSYSFIFSYEVSANPIGYFNFWNCSDIYQGAISSLKNLSDYLKKDTNCFLSIKKPTIGILNMAPYKLFKDRIRLIELEDYSNESISPYENIYYNLLDKGWMIGAISSFNIDKDDFLPKTYTAIPSTNIYPSTIIDILKSRKTYFTSRIGVKMYFSCSSIPMGSSLIISKSQKYIDLYMYIESPERNICRIQIISNNKKIIKDLNTPSLYKLEYVFRIESSIGDSWYVAKVFTSEKILAISSPIFIKKK